ncbi:hypothetical protein GF314_16335 [bacterium]|nr:hypothetical protein [bacterium]
MPRRLPLRDLDPRDVIALLVLVAALSATVYHLTADLAPRNEANALTFVRSNASLENYQRLRQEWRSRVGANGAAHLVSEAVADGRPAGREHLRRTVATHSAIWLALVNVALLAGLGRRALVIVWGVFAAVVFGYAPGLVSRIYPWDLPALFWFALALVLWHRGRWRWLVAAIAVGMLFKETVVVLLVALALRDEPWRRRWRLLAVAAGLTVAVKLAADLTVANPATLVTATTRPPDGGALRLWDNLHLLGSMSFAHPAWLNAGTLVALLILPGRERWLTTLRAVAAVFLVATFLFGVVSEYRIWFELAPLAVYALARRYVWDGTDAVAGSSVAGP